MKTTDEKFLQTKQLHISTILSLMVVLENWLHPNANPLYLVYIHELLYSHSVSAFGGLCLVHYTRNLKTLVSKFTIFFLNCFFSENEQFHCNFLPTMPLLNNDFWTMNFANGPNNNKISVLYWRNCFLSCNGKRKKEKCVFFVSFLRLWINQSFPQHCSM